MTQADDQQTERDFTGVLAVDKPGGMTSRDVLNRLQRAIPGVKLGHTGTLDPLATGVLVICAGKATRLVDDLHDWPKTYRGVFLLGRSSDTEDISGEIREHPEAPRPTSAALREALPRFVGEIQQVPPAYSALRVGGQRAYHLARKGKNPQLAPRPVEIHRLEITSYEYPRLELTIHCGSGTYVRSLGRDLARAVGTEAVLESLVRTAVGPFDLAGAAQLSELTPERFLRQLLPVRSALPNLPIRTLTDAELKSLEHTGRFEVPPQITSQAPRWLLLAPDGRAIAIAAVLAPGVLRSEKRVG